MKRNFMAVVCLAGLTTIFSHQASAQDAKPAPGQIIKYYNDGKRDPNGPEFRMYISTKEAGKLRAVDVDADGMVPVTLKSGKKVLAPAVAFISNFDILNAEAMRGLSKVQQDLIKAAGNNRSVDRKQVAFMLQHIKIAHGVEYDEVKKAAKTSERYFDLD